MSGYINSKNNLNETDFLSLFKKLYYFIKDKIYPKPNEELSFDELAEVYSNDKNFLNKLDYIKNLLDDIDELMEDINFKYDEHYNFSSIKNMVTYIVSDVGKYLKYSSFIIILLTDFNNLLDSQNNPDYENIYKKFDIELYKQEDIFYTEIFEYTHEHDDLIDKVTNILWWLKLIHFYDTNVIIGYIYSVDPLNKASKKAITKNNDNYYSEHAKTEVNNVTFRKDREYDKFLRKIFNIIKKTNDNSLIDLSRIPAEINKFKTIRE